MRDTIYALATAPGRAAVAAVRVSGPRAREALAALSGRAAGSRGMRLARLRSPADGSEIDQALTLWFPGPGSYTGEDVVELHLHGGKAVVEAVLKALADLGLRPAEPGEFTRRAFEHGKLDLAQAEAVADLIDAEGEAQRRQALGQLGGALSARYEAWRTRLIDALAFLEASVDFPDEELPEDLDRRVAPMVTGLIVELEGALADARRGERVREGFAVAVLGAPNAGKSTLFNALVGRDAAIVTATAGTTRDVIEVGLRLQGYEVRLADTAGVREAADDIEAEGVRRALRSAEAADLRIVVVDGSASDGAWRAAARAAREGDLWVVNKRDLPLGADGRDVLGSHPDALHLSGGGADAEVSSLMAVLEGHVVAAMAGAEFPAVTRERHRLLLEDALRHLVRGREAIVQGSELAAEDLRLAARALERVAGRIDPEEILGRVFAQFCIGK